MPVLAGVTVTMTDATRALRWGVAMEALRDAGVDAETFELVERARAIEETVMSMTRVLLGVADAKQPKNYIKVEMVGLTPPWDRAYVELMRPGGRTSHELRELLRDRLTLIRRLLADGDLPDAMVAGMIAGIDEDLATEAP